MPDDTHPLRTYREVAGLTLQELATKAGTTKATLSRIENGRTPQPRLKLVNRLCKVSRGKLSPYDFVPTDGAVA